MEKWEETSGSQDQEFAYFIHGVSTVVPETAQAIVVVANRSDYLVLEWLSRIGRVILCWSG